jgi:hypothetical protein
VGRFNQGETVVLTTGGSATATWTGCTSSTATTCTVSMTANRSVTATLTVPGQAPPPATDGGTVSPPPPADAGTTSPSPADAGTASPPPAPVTQTFSLSADATVRQGTSTNSGTSTTLETVSSSTSARHVYFRVTVSGVLGRVTSAKVRLYASNGSGNGPKLLGVANTSWGETTINWSNKPAAGTTVIANPASISTSSWVELDVSSVITGNGTYSFVLVPESSDNAIFASRQSGTTTQRPQVVVVSQ